MRILREIPPKQKAGEYVAVDIEIFAAEEHLLHLPITGRFASLQIALTNGDVYVITDEKDVQPALDAISKCMWVLMKGQFDIAHLRRWANVPDRELLIDIMYVDKIIWSGYFENFAFSLVDMARRYLDLYLDKDIREQFNTATELSEEMLNYAATDALLTLRIAEKQRNFLTKDQYELIWQDIDLPATWAFLASKPFRIDRDAWEQLAIRNKTKQEEINATLDFNPGSWVQVKEKLRKCGFKDLPSTGEEVLQEYITKYPDTEAARLAELVLESRMYGKRASTYGMKFIERHLFQEGDYWVMKPDYFTIGAETGRVSCSGLHQIPIRDTKDFRDCFLAREGNKLVIADYSSQEPRIAAYLSQDQEYIRVMNSGEDIYTEATFHLYESREEAIANRKNNKDIVLGTTYGLTKYGLARKWGLSVDNAEQFIAGFFARFPKLHRFLNGLSKKTNYVNTAVGRKIWLNKYSSQCANNAQNGPHQGTAADMIKRAVAVCYKEWKPRWGAWALVECVHDEIGFDVPEKYANEVADWVRGKMIQVGQEMCAGVTFEVSVTVCDRWSESK